MTFTIKDSGERQQFSSGMVRDTTDDKTDYTLVLDGPMFERWAQHLTKGAKKYAVRNWMKAEGEAELQRFKQSALRHFVQWMSGNVDEDHAAAVFFNINGAAYVMDKLQISSGLSEMPRPTCSQCGGLGWLPCSTVNGFYNTICPACSSGAERLR